MKDYPNLDAKAATANQAMDTILALTAKLQRAEARALAAEMQLKRIHDVYFETWQIPNNCDDREHFVKQILREDVDLAAAREVLRKAEECGQFDGYIDRIASACNVDVTVNGHTFPPEMVVDACIETIDLFRRDAHDYREEADTLRTERDELAALAAESARKAAAFDHIASLRTEWSGHCCNGNWEYTFIPDVETCDPHDPKQCASAPTLLEAVEMTMSKEAGNG